MKENKKREKDEVKRGNNLGKEAKRRKRNKTYKKVDGID